MMIMNLFNLSLKNLFNSCNHKFFLKTVLLLTNQLISHIEYIHAKSFIYRDIKPGNFLMSIEKDENQINIINFNLIKKYHDSKTHVHISYHENKKLTDTAHYVSINTHQKLKQF